MKRYKRGILLLNGEPTDERYIVRQTDEFVVCCDGAYGWASKYFTPDLIVGDFDSCNFDLLPTDVLKERYPAEKDYTDGEIALRKLIDAGVKEITVYGLGGKRDDHFFGNLQLLYYAFCKNVSAVAVTNDSKIFFASGVIFLSGIKEKTVSLAPFAGDAHIINSEGLKYPLKKLTLRCGSCRGLSNVALTDGVVINCSKGQLLVFINH